MCSFKVYYNLKLEVDGLVLKAPLGAGIDTLLASYHRIGFDNVRRVDNEFHCDTTLLVKKNFRMASRGP